MARKGSLGVFRANDEEVEFRGVTVPQKLRVQSLGIGGDPDMFAEFEISAGLAECTRIEYVRSKAGGRAVQTTDLQQISDLQAYVEDAFLRYSRVIAEFRANKGEVGGQFQGAPLLLIHHRDRETGKEYVAPIFYLASDEEDVIYVFATLGAVLLIRTGTRTSSRRDQPSWKSAPRSTRSRPPRSPASSGTWSMPSRPGATRCSASTSG